MKKIRRIFSWCFLLNKRLFKKVSFLLILAVVPFLVVALTTAAQEDSGILTIALSQENPSDKEASAVVEKIIEDAGIIRYIKYDEPKDARKAVESGKADAAWIFFENMQEKIDAFVVNSTSSEPIVKILAREDNVFIQLSREKLFAALYSKISHSLYTDFILTEVTDGNADMESLERNYNVTAVDKDIIQFAFMDSDVSAEEAENANYVTAPVRGMLALMIVLIGMAASMYLIQDDMAGTYVWLPAKAKLPFSYGWHFIAVVDMAVIVLIALAASGLFTTWEREIPLMIIYCAACTGFCNVVRMLCGKMERLGVAIPIIMLLMLVLCPLFLNVRRLRVIQYLLPPFYYLHGVNNSDFTVLLAVYSVGIYVLGYVINKFNRRHE